jgi:cell division protein FtsI/penicillin-binding protein 2
VAFPRRLTLLLVVLAGLLAVVWARVFSLQVLSGDAWRRSAHEMRHPGTRVDAPRGRILDARGRVLVQDEAAVGLAFVADDWERRVRFRCPECGAVHARRALEGKEGRPRQCSCRAPGARLVVLPDEDLSPLEDALGLERGLLARFAAARVRLLEQRVERLARRTVERLDLDEFREADVRKTLREDHFRRAHALREKDFGAAWRPPVADLSPEALRILELDDAGRYRGFSARASLARRASCRGLLGQCLGRTTLPGREDLERFGRLVSSSTPLGRSGVEGYYDDWLRGVPGVRYERAEGEEEDDDVPAACAPEAGADLRLSLDLDACIEAQRLLDEVATAEGYAPRGPPSGGFVVLDAKTGRVLAWSEAPRFDPAAGVAAPMTDEEATALRERAPGTPPPEVETFDLRATPSVEASRVAQVAVEPGSSFKTLTALFVQTSPHPFSGGLSCSGPARGRNDAPGCHHAHGALNFEDAMCVSCNRWFAAALARREVLQPFRATYPAFARSLGIERKTGIDFAAEGKGVFRAEGEYSYRHLAIGQGPVKVTPLQMARLMALLSNGGRLVTPRLATSIGLRPVAPEWVDFPVPPAVASSLRRGMSAVVEREGGTAFAAFRDVPPPPGVSVFGKTGTAQVPDGGDFDPDRLEDGPWHHWFVGFAERGGDSIAFAMVLYARKEQEAGGHTAARAVARYLRWWYERTPSR